MVELALVGVVGQQRIEQVLVEVLPVLERKMFAEQSGRYVQRYERGLYGYRSRTAHGVIQVGLPVPACHEQHTCRQSFADRCFGGSHTPAAFVQALAATVQRDGHRTVGYMDVDI